MAVKKCISKGFYFVVVLLSCNIFFLSGSGFCQRIKKLFDYKSSQKKVIVDDDSQMNHDNNENEELEYQCMFLSAIGHSVGKTSILKVAKGEKFDKNIQRTSGVDFFNFDFNGKNLRLWEVGVFFLQCRIPVDYYHVASGFVFVYDISNEESLKELENVIKGARENKRGHVLFFLLGNKIDLENEESAKEEQAQKFAKDNNLIFLGVCSAKNGDYYPNSVNSCFSKELDNEGRCEKGVKGVVHDIFYNLDKKEAF